MVKANQANHLLLMLAHHHRTFFLQSESIFSQQLITWLSRGFRLKTMAVVLSQVTQFTEMMEPVIKFSQKLIQPMILKSEIILF